MGKKSRRPKRQKDPEHDLEKDEVVDQDNEEFFLDEIDKFHADKEKILLEDAGGARGSYNDIENEEEVLAVESEDDDDSEQEQWQDTSSDEEVKADKKKDDDGISSRKAWGKKRSAFYGADDFHGLEGSDREEAEMVEEQEVLVIQKRLAEQIDEDDIGLDILQDDDEDVETKGEESLSHVKADLSSLSVKAQWKLAKKEAPELDGLIKDFKTKLKELENQVHPLMELVKSGRIPEGHGRDYIVLRYRVYLSYLLNISFYLALKAKKLPIQNHPVVSRLVQYRTVINQLAPIDEKLQPKIKDVLEDSDEDVAESSPVATSATVDVEMEVHSDEEEVPLPKKARKRPTEKEIDARNEKVALDYYKSISEKLQEQTEKVEEKLSNEPEEDDAADERRAINYEIAKNRGLKQKRKKIDRNPRVKMRQKYKKAKIRRKGQVREYRPEINKYAGEPTGIRIGLKKSIPLQ